MNNRRLNAALATAACLLALCSPPMSAATATNLRADSALLDGKTGEYQYRGNALLSQDNIRIRADDMQAVQDQNGGLKNGRFRGSPAVLEHTDPVTGATTEASANEIVYDTVSGQIQLLGNALLIQDEPTLKRQMRLQAADIRLVERNGQLNDLSALGSPAVFSRQEQNALPIEGQANELRYLGGTEQLVLEGSAKLQQGQTIFEHVIIEYDGARKLISAPKRDGQQVRITRTPTPDPEAVKPAAGTGASVNQPQPKTFNKDTP